MYYSVPATILGRFYTDQNGNSISSDDPRAPMNPGGRADNYWTLDSSNRVKPMPALQGLISMSPCEDGTIFVSVVYREAWADSMGDGMLYWRATDAHKYMYTTGYAINVQAGTIHVDEPWTRLNGEALRVRKMPIPCWALMSSLKTKLEMPRPRRQRDT
jgi:hypothetical protein